MKIVIAGGGLVGSLCACILGQKGHQVELYELRNDPKSEVVEQMARGRSINLALSVRGRTTLRLAGLEDLVLDKGLPMKGRMLHSLNGDTKEVLYDPMGNQCIYSVSRQYLNDLLLEEAAKIPNVNVHYNCKVIYSDPIKGIVKIRRSEHKKLTDDVELEVEADLLIGADGAHSAMRQSFLKNAMINFSQNYIEHGYMELCIPSKSNGQHAMSTNNLHIWPRNQFMLIALPNQDGSFTATLFMPFQIFGELSTSESVIKFFEREFPDALNLIGKDLLIEDFLGSKPSNLISIKCNPLNVGKGILIGDSAHAMVPFYGQGMNAGFEDILLLANLLDENMGGDGDCRLPIEDCLKKFSEERSKDALAICELAMYNYLEMRDLVNRPTFYLRRTIDLFLYKVLGERWVPLYNSVTFTTIPYSACIQNRERQDKTLKKVTDLFLTLTSGSVLFILLLSRKQIHHHIGHFTQSIWTNILTRIAKIK